MSKLVVCTIADDRMGRKEGLYSETQDKIAYILNNNPQLGVDEMIHWKWENIAATPFYEENKTLLDNIDAAKNGRAYKPYIIHSALSYVNEGDFVVYTDCSPEMWSMDREAIFPYMYFNTDVIKRLCKFNNDILSIFVKWDTIDIPTGGLGKHTHKYFTLDRCIDRMGMREYENSFMGASGMWCIRKTASTMEFVSEWLKWNCDEDCCALGKANDENDYSFWTAESDVEFGKEGKKMGHRHDQSISGLLLNKRGAKFVDILYNDISPYNFLQYCRTDVGFKFIDGNTAVVIPETIIEEEEAPPIINVGDRVKNSKGIELNVYKKEGNNYVVGRSPASCYGTTKDKLTLI